jgi:hypothetical protein
MIAKIVQGSGFKGVVNYVLGKDKAQLLFSEGVRIKDKESIISSFIAQCSANPISKPVAHISLNFSPQDMAKMTDAEMMKIAGEYMEKMGYGNTQFIMVRHNDRQHPHVHLVVNRIDNNGNYEPNNCRWVTVKENSNNTRKSIYIDCPDGQRRTLLQLSEMLGLDLQLLRYRCAKNKTIKYSELIVPRKRRNK